MKSRNIIGIALLGIVLFQTACFKEKIDETKVLTDNMKSQNPYLENNKLYFASESEQVLIMQVSSRTNKFLEVATGNYSPVYLVEVDITTIKSVDTARLFEFEMKMEAYTTPRFSISILDPTGQKSWVHYDLPLSKNTPGYIGSVYVKEKWLHDIYLAESNTFKLYYSTEFGIIKFDNANSYRWELNKITK
ncbi:MAG: hypothetical protein KKF98_14905 [Bacteroidetes bacterium]|nr:hypothetical protein [Bacteroidota bacterium]